MTTQYNIQATAYDKKGMVLAIAVNNYRKTHPLQAHFAKLVGEDEKIYLHAEIAVMIKAALKGKIEFIEVVRYNKQGETRLAKPCRICQAAGKAFGVKFFSYSTNEGTNRGILETTC